MTPNAAIREHLKDLLSWRSAHAEFERVVKNVPTEVRGRRPDGAPYSLWQLLEHIRRSQWDILDFCVNEDYSSPQWPDDFWPADPEPPTREDWQKSIDSYRRDRQALADVIQDPSIDPHAPIPHGEGQTYLREIILVADHTAYHVGQMVLLRRMLGVWPP